MSRKPHKLLCAAAIAACVAALAACGNSGGSNNAAQNGTATGSPIKVMNTATLSSPNLSYPQSVDGAKAAADAINKAGGVNGHPIEVLSCNDGLDPNKAATCLQQAVQNKVVALVGGINLFSAELWSGLHAAGIPWVGISVISQDQGTDSMSYPLTSGTPGIFTESGRLAVEHGGKNVVILRHENSQSAYVANYIAQGVALAGGTVVKTVTSNIGNPDTTSAAAQVMSAHPDGVGCACNQGDGARLLKSLRQAGYTGAFTASVSTVPQSDVTALGGLTSNVWLAADSRAADDPKAQQFVSEMNAENPSANLDNVASDTWLAVHTIADLLKGQPSPTSANLIKALNSGMISTDDLAGPSFSFAAPGPLQGAPRVANPAVIDLTVKAGQITSVTGAFRNPLSGS
jgi:ABC-type branched-subunit amino acid transport system substrate-binding protein